MSRTPSVHRRWRAALHFFRNSWEGGGRASSWIDRLPVVFHARDGPASGFCFVEAFVELADVGLAVIGPFALGIGVMDGEAESWAAACGGSLQHLEVAIGVAEGGKRASADMTLDAHRLALLVVVEDESWQFHQDRGAVVHFEF